MMNPIIAFDIVFSLSESGGNTFLVKMENNGCLLGSFFFSRGPPELETLTSECFRRTWSIKFVVLQLYLKMEWHNRQATLLLSALSQNQSTIFPYYSWQSQNWPPFCCAAKETKYIASPSSNIAVSLPDPHIWTKLRLRCTRCCLHVLKCKFLHVIYPLTTFFCLNPFIKNYLNYR